MVDIGYNPHIHPPPKVKSCGWANTFTKLEDDTNFTFQPWGLNGKTKTII